MKPTSFLRKVGPVTLVAFGCVVVAVSQAPPWPLPWQDCVYNEDCGTASKACWGDGHANEQDWCFYCDGSGNYDVCVKSNNYQPCQSTGIQYCGYRVGGTCVGGPIGTCSAKIETGDPCAVPKC